MFLAELFDPADDLVMLQPFGSSRAGSAPSIGRIGAPLKAAHRRHTACLTEEDDRRIHDILEATAAGDDDLLVRPSEKGHILMETAHSSALHAKHAGLDARIAAESGRPSPDGTLLARLKKQKLKIKEALQRL